MPGDAFKTGDGERNEKGCPGECTAKHDLSTEELVFAVKQKIEELRDEQRRRVLRIYETEPDLIDKSSGDVFIESIGSIVHLENGDFQHIYNLQAIAARDKMTLPFVRDRRKMFEAIAAQFVKGSRVLNIGAGGDTVPINALKLAGNDVVNTDLSQEAADALSRRTDTPVFAVDLVNLEKVMPAKSVDYMFGNSTLGYIEPNKLKKVVENICSIMKKGGVFTFDLFPHGVYTRVFEGGENQTVVNESEICPVRLLELIRKYGPKDGINAMGVYHNYKSMAVQLALMELLKELFEENGYGAACGFYESVVSKNYQSKILRVASPGNEASLLDPVPGEKPFYNMNEGWDLIVREMDAAAYRLLCLDRRSAALLAKELDIEGEFKELPYIVARYVAENQNPGFLPAEIHAEITKSIHPSIIREAVVPYINGKKVLPLKPLPMAVQVDQVLHKMVMSGQAPFDADVAEAKIDTAYANREFCREGKDSGCAGGAGKRPVMKRNGHKGVKKKKNNR